VRTSGAGQYTLEFIFNMAGQHTSVYDVTHGWELAAHAYWGQAPLSFYFAGTTHFEHQDMTGTERARTDVNGNVTGTYHSLPFGDGYLASGTDNDAYHFATLDQDNTANEHAQFREYSNMAGRWFSPDPYAGSYDPSNPQSFNRYAYVMNGPLSYIDPLGLDGDCPRNSACPDFSLPYSPPPPDPPNPPGTGGNGGGGPCNGYGGPALPTFIPVTGVNGQEIAEVPGTGPRAAAGCKDPTGPQGGGGGQGNDPNPPKPPKSPVNTEVCTTDLTGVVKCETQTQILSDLFDLFPTCGQVKKVLANVGYTGDAITVGTAVYTGGTGEAVPGVAEFGIVSGTASLISLGLEYDPNCK
jgi:RHS repeat-associated protein